MEHNRHARHAVMARAPRHEARRAVMAVSTAPYSAAQWPTRRDRSPRGTNPHRVRHAPHSDAQWLLGGTAEDGTNSARFKIG